MAVFRMNELRPAARRYIAALTIAAFAAMVAAFVSDHGFSWEHAALAVGLTVLLAFSWLFPLRIAFKTQLYLDTSIVVTAILTLEPGLAIAASGAGIVAAQWIRRQDRVQMLFNTAQMMLQTATGAAVLSLGAWEIDAHTYNRPRSILFIFLAGVAMTLVTDFAVATMVALQHATPLGGLWARTVIVGDPTERLAQFAQIGIGVIGAVLIQSYLWTFLLLLIPSAAVYLSLERAIASGKITERALADTEAALIDAQRVAHLGSWDWDLASGSQIWSDEMFRIFGYQPQAFLPNWNVFLRSIHPEDRGEVDKAIHEAIYTGERFGLDHRIVRPDGSERIVHAEGDVVFGEKGEKDRFVGTIQDVTERKQAERARETLLASVSHDLKSPLTVIRGHAQFLQLKARRGTGGPDELVEGLSKIDAAANRMSVQLTELLDVARLQMGEELELHRIHVDLLPVIRDRIATHMQTTRRHEITLQTDAEEIAGEWDRERLERVIDNLIGNAIKYSPAGGEIEVRAAVEKNGSHPTATIAVTDHGVGIPEEDLEHVFAPFQRGANVGSIPGSGIGLAGANQIVVQHGGTIQVTSTEGSGSTFTVRLPM
jgi:PAS domain S-box-containing protein